MFYVICKIRNKKGLFGSLLISYFLKYRNRYCKVNFILENNKWVVIILNY